MSMALAAVSTAAAAADDEAICTDRPSRATGTCTTPRGRIQIETGLVDWTRYRAGGIRTDLTAWGGSLIKYGLSAKADVEIGVTPLVELRVRGQGIHERDSSFGDTLLRVKYQLTQDEAPVQIALDPFVKLPTANRRLGNRKVEGGVTVPVQMPIGSGPFTLSLGPEIDVRADADGHGDHFATQQVVNVGIALSRQLSVSTELWAAWDWEPSGTAKQASWDGAVAYDIGKDLQLDAGANFGLNRQTPGVEVYSGFSVRF